jgi:hypothetical protein
MRTPREVTEPLRGILTTVPPREVAGACRICHGAPKPGFRVCFACQKVTNQVAKPVKLIAPISLSDHEGQLYRILSNSERSRDPVVQREAADQVACLFLRFVGDHADCIRRVAGRRWSGIAMVPDQQDPQRSRPLETALERRQLPLVHPLQAGREEVRPMAACDAGYEVVMDVAGMSLLLVDDVLNTSAHLQSAASALQRAGADVVAAVLVVRLLNPQYKEEAELLARAGATPFDFKECCLEHENPLGI